MYMRSFISHINELGDTLERHEKHKEKPKKNHKLLKSFAEAKLFLFLTKKLSLQPIIYFQ